VSDISSNSPALAYLTTDYPNVSHTFIRREIQGLERLGRPVARFALRAGTVVDAEDRAEDDGTTQILEQPLSRLAVQLLRGAARAGTGVFRALGLAWRLGKASDRGVLRHLAYVGEALVLLDQFAAAGVAHVHVHFGTNVAAIALMVRRMGGPSYSMTVHGPDEFDAPIGFSLGLKVEESAFTVAITHYCAAQIRRWVSYEHWDRIRIVHCTVGTDWFDAARPVDPEARDVVCVGRLSAQKGQLLLIDALASACDRGFRGRLVLIGDGELRGAIERRIAAHGLEDRVELTGWADAPRIRERLLAARALAAPSFAEGLPVVIMEAMALERPVLASRITGVPELVESGANGWLVTAGDVDGLCEALLAVDRADVDTLRALGRSAQEAVRRAHDQMTEAARLEHLFDALPALAAREANGSGRS
tara:strand:+ start:7568 stop:8827 length:1260 start_codon:yes stop_codon:yes gene_type:complete